MDASFPAVSRRTFLSRLAALGVGMPTLLTACSSDDVVDASTCRGYDPDTAPLRRTLGYVDASEVDGQYCKNCRFYTAPAGAGDRCGGCQLIPGLGANGRGPVSPGGYCRSWTPVPA